MLYTFFTRMRTWFCKPFKEEEQPKRLQEDPEVIIRRYSGRVLYYFFVLRPREERNKRFKELQEYLRKAVLLLFNSWKSLFLKLSVFRCFRKEIHQLFSEIQSNVTVTTFEVLPDTKKISSMV